jgi:Mg-chelatase subunit ChlD/uncharacterized protein YfiM (DUF2279 family)
MLVLIAILLPILLFLVAMAVDVGYIQLVRTEMRASTDAAARAAGEALSRTQNLNQARQAAKNLAAANKVAADPLLLDDSDIVFGLSTLNPDGSWSFNPSGSPINAARINGRRTRNSLSGSVPLYFGRFMGINDFEPSQTASSVRLDRDLCLVLDRSGSMDTNDAGNGLTRWQALRQAVTEFRNGIDTTQQTELLGLSSYATTAQLDVHLTSNYSQIDSAVNSMDPAGSTNIAGGIDKGILVLTNTSTARPFAAKTMIVLTDGIWNQGRSPVLAAQDAALAKITIHSVTYSSQANQSDMLAVAAATGGKHYHAPNGAALQDIFREIALSLPVILTE